MGRLFHAGIILMAISIIGGVMAATRVPIYPWHAIAETVGPYYHLNATALYGSPDPSPHGEVRYWIGLWFIGVILTLAGYVLSRLFGEEREPAPSRYYLNPRF